MSQIELTIVPRDRDLGGFSVRRVLPYVHRRMVGPFVFLDHMGPADFPPGQGIDVRPHPHIGLATVTYLFEGRIFHRDTLGSALPIEPGAVNWMTAGRGIAHSERTTPEDLAHPRRLHGLQSWVALPLESEETAPEFHHHPAATLPAFTQDGVALRLVAGSLFDRTAPVKIHSPLFYAEAKFPAGATLTLPADDTERAIYLVEGALRVGEEAIAPGSLAVFKPGAPVAITAETPSLGMLLGGEPLAEPRHIWWNFVSSSEARIEQAKADWREKKFGLVPGDEADFIPLPD